MKALEEKMLLKSISVRTVNEKHLILFSFALSFTPFAAGICSWVHFTSKWSFFFRLFLFFQNPFALCSNGTNSFLLHCTEAGTGFSFVDFVEQRLFLLKKAKVFLKKKKTINYHELLFAIILRLDFFTFLRAKLSVPARRKHIMSLVAHSKSNKNAVLVQQMEHLWTRVAKQAIYFY